MWKFGEKCAKSAGTPSRRAFKRKEASLPLSISCSDLFYPCGENWLYSSQSNQIEILENAKIKNLWDRNFQKIKK